MRLLNFLILTFLLCVAVVYTQGQNNNNSSTDSNNNNNTPQTSQDLKPSNVLTNIPTNIPNNNNNNNNNDDQKKKEEEEKKKKEEEAKKKKEEEGKKGNEEGNKGNDNKDNNKNNEENENEWEDIDMDSFPKVKDSDDVIIFPVFPTSLSRTIKSGQKIKILWYYKKPESDGEKQNFVFKQKDYKEIQIALMVGSDVKQVFVQNVTTVDTKAQSVDYTMPKTKFKGKIYYFRFTIIPEDSSKKIGLAWTTRFDFFNTDNGNFVEIDTSDSSLDLHTEEFNGSKAVAQTIKNENSSAFTLSTVASLCFSLLFITFAQF